MFSVLSQKTHIFKALLFTMCHYAQRGFFKTLIMLIWSLKGWRERGCIRLWREYNLQYWRWLYFRRYNYFWIELNLHVREVKNWENHYYVGFGICLTLHEIHKKLCPTKIKPSDFKMSIPRVISLYFFIWENRGTEGCWKLQRFIDMKSSGQNGPNVRTNASPKWGRTRCLEE